ncbi:uncharacterized protein [Apostichopus japonicus]|uniref:uncharacterized protein n=1 Tax=Stichopus japonicus TaxID=307972 RepID=UPI003AB69866
MSRNPLKCINCSMFRPGRAWDEHDLCPKCRSCTRRDPCLVCIKFTPAQWQDIDLWLEGLRSKLQGRLDSIPSAIGAPEVPGIMGDREEEGVVEREVEESGQERAEGEKEVEREERERERIPLTAPATSGSVTARGKGRSKGKAPARKRPPKQRHSSAGLETPSQSGPQLNRPTERGPPAVGGSGPKERATEGTRRRSRSRSREPDREPERRVPTEIPARESRERESSRRPRRERSGSHTRSPRRRERKRYSPISDESSDSSDDGYRRSKRRRRSPRRRQEEEPAWLSKLTGLLRPLLEQRTSTVADVAPGPTSPVSTMAPQPAPDPDALDCRASVNLSGLEDEGEPIDPDPLDYDPMEDSFGHNYEPEEAPVTGGALPQELITQPQKAGRVSKLTATGEAFEAIANKTKWTAFPARADRAVRVPDEAWKDLFRCPTIPQEAKERLKAEQGASSTHVFKTPDQRKLEELLVEVDMAALSGMKFASVLMLSAEVLMRHHQQLPEDSSQLPMTSITTDASLSGWGAHWSNRTAWGTWSQTETSLHINILEMMAVKRALEAFNDHVQGTITTIFTDNTTVVAYINRQGGTRSERLCRLAWEVITAAEDSGTILRASHIAGKLNNGIEDKNSLDAIKQIRILFFLWLSPRDGQKCLVKSIFIVEL